MRVLITGGAGFLGRGLAQELSQSKPEVDEIILFDQVSMGAEMLGTTSIAGDLVTGRELDAVFARGIDIVVHLAAVVSAAAEADFDLGYRVNLDGTRRLLDLCRTSGKIVRLVFTSSIAVFGRDTPKTVEDDTAARPQSSYGTQKAMGELLLNDASRKGLIDARCLRMPTVVVRPGRPNAAASSFASSIIREPLAGERTVCPVPADTALWLTSPRQAVAALAHAMDLPAEAWGDDRVLNVPGITATVAQMAEAAKRAGADTGLIDWRPDPAIAAIVRSWPARMNAARARRLGFEPVADIDAIIRDHIEYRTAGSR